MDDIRTQYKNMVKILLDGGSPIGIATHDDELIDWAKTYVIANNVPKSQFEFQMLYRLRRRKRWNLSNKASAFVLMCRMVPLVPILLSSPS